MKARDDRADEKTSADQHQKSASHPPIGPPQLTGETDRRDGADHPVDFALPIAQAARIEPAKALRAMGDR